jgi:tyrosyl-tRNA synthetase
MPFFDQELQELQENVAIITPEGGLKEKLFQSRKEKRPLIVKLGIDPTSADLHIGHAVTLKKMRQFQKWGHLVVIIIGDFTAKIGDPTGKNKTRPELSDEQIAQNAKTYLEQLSLILDMSQVQVRANSEWLSVLNCAQVIRLLSQVTVAQILTRQDFHQRYSQGVSIQMHEIFYPLLQGQDSVMIHADIEMGGTDQLFNCMVGRHLQEMRQESAQVVVSMPLLVGLDGSDKMSKSLNNTIPITCSSETMFGKVMSISDQLMPSYLRLTTDFSSEEKQLFLSQLELGQIHPMELKKRIAVNLVKQYHSDQMSQHALTYFENQFQNKGEKQYLSFSREKIFADQPFLSLLDLCVRLQPEQSKSQMKRLIEASAVSLNEEKKKDPFFSVLKPPVALRVQIGKRGFYSIEP